MNEERIRELVRGASAPEERGAQERAWRVVRAAFAQRRAAPKRDATRRLAVALAVALLVLALVLTPAGAKVADLVRDVFRPGERSTRPALTSLPAPGRLLVSSAQGPWIVDQDGSMRLLGVYDTGTWSPHGLYVAVTRGHQLSAVDPVGDVRWSLAQRHRVSDASWSPSGFRIAYLAGDSLRVVAADGTGDRLLRDHVDAVTPAWKPVLPSALRANPAGTGTHILAFANRNGIVQVVDTDSKRIVWRSAPGPRPTFLEWSADGKRLLALDTSGWRFFGRSGRLIVDAHSPDLATPTAASFAPHGNALAVVQTRTTGGAAANSRIFLVHPSPSAKGGTGLLTLPGRVTSATWSPDGRWLLIAWKDADQWLFLHPTHARKGQDITAVSNVSRQFAPGGRGQPPFPQIDGWCCSR